MRNILAEKKITYYPVVACGLISDFCLLRNLLRLHNLDESEHLIRTFVGILLFFVGHGMLGLKIFAPKLIYPLL